MSSRIREHIRKNVYGMVAIFIALGGTAYAVDGPNPGVNTIGSEDIIGGEVKSSDIGNGLVSSVDLKNGTIETAKIQDGAIVNGKIQDSAIESDKILNGTVTRDDLAASPDWTPLVLSADYDDASGSHTVPGCYRDIAGVVHYRGVAQHVNGTGTTLMGGPPIECKPFNTGTFVVARIDQTGTPTGTADITVSLGGISVNSNVPPINHRISLEGLTYRGG